MGFNVIFPLALSKGHALVFSHLSPNLLVSRKECALIKVKCWDCIDCIYHIDRVHLFVALLVVSDHTRLFFLSLNGEIHKIKELSRTHVSKLSYGWGNRRRSHLECIKHNNTSQRLSRLGWERSGWDLNPAGVVRAAVCRSRCSSCALLHRCEELFQLSCSYFMRICRICVFGFGHILCYKQCLWVCLCPTF